MARAGLTSARISEAGAELADEVGLDRVTVSEVARRLGVKAPSLYAHVASSDDLRTRIALLALQEMADHGADALAGRAGADALAALGNVYRDYGHHHPGRYDAARLPLDAATAAASAGPRHSAMMRAVLRGYDLTEADQTHAVRLLGSVFHGYVSLERGGGFSHSSPDAQQSWEKILESLHALLLGWPTS
ncbi:TetR/AcrR family transcriptional regulator [Aeromicrobium sp. Root472D3]|uniref:TetR/AcrR family transcriptional regulator n=1 Tax=Aeromicrobium sp. Root472D3 TaxID=1736540 RepID=UPI0006F5E4E0|nr:TetR/AcrR family transcriptional regulator [Aeromicrobium sp. Root472D3]KQX75071.1 TetR family transcriptional regulator [Aeromicrobium sp. Root472D3]